MSITGSSPHTRGTQLQLHQHHRRRRLIPAHAETTLDEQPVKQAREAHSRAYGEHPVRLRRSTRAAGSSRAYGKRCCQCFGSFPHTRGRPRNGALARRGGGLIPAHAGTTLNLRQLRSTIWAHSRSRGDDGRQVEGQSLDGGSFPLTRGRHLLTRHDTRAKPKNYSLSTRI